MKRFIVIITGLTISDIIFQVITLSYVKTLDIPIITQISFNEILSTTVLATLFFPIVEEILYRIHISKLNWRKIILFFISLFVYGYYKEVVILNEFTQDIHLWIWEIASYIVPIVLVILVLFWKEKKLQGARLWTLFGLSTLGFIFQHGDLFTRNEMFGQSEGSFLPLTRFIGLFVLGSACFYIAKKYGLKWAIVTHAIYNFSSVIMSYVLAANLFR